MNLDMAIGAIRVLRILVMLRTSRLISPDTMRRAVARQAELPDPAGYQ